MENGGCRERLSGSRCDDEEMGAIGSSRGFNGRRRIEEEGRGCRRSPAGTTPAGSEYFGERGLLRIANVCSRVYVTKVFGKIIDGDQLIILRATQREIVRTNASLLNISG